MSYKFGKSKTRYSVYTKCIQCGYDEVEKNNDLINGLCYTCMCKNDECIRCKKKRNHKGWGWKCEECNKQISEKKIHQHNLNVISNSKSKILSELENDLEELEKELDLKNKKEIQKSIWPFACDYCKERKLSTSEIKNISTDYIFNSDPCSGCKNNYNFSKYI
jgi:hypothetical protein